MCGIFGIVSRNENYCRRAVEQLDLIAHRGPDERGYWSEGGVFIGNRRLSIIDLSGGQPPIGNDDGSCWIVYNGELYNFLYPQPELQGKAYRFKTKSDTEVSLR